MIKPNIVLHLTSGNLTIHTSKWDEIQCPKTLLDKVLGNEHFKKTLIPYTVIY